MQRRIYLSIVALSLCFGGFLHTKFAVAQDQDQPNILIILSDDQRDGTLGKYMPIVQERIFNQGVNFSQGYITTPACCPSRATILTGMYVSKNGVLTNSSKLKRKKTLLQILKRAGYYTGLIGKYLNTWNGTPRQETDYWVSFRGGSSDYFNPKLNVNGEWQHHEGYMTYILRDYVLDFLDAAEDSAKPFFLYFTPNSPHQPFTPATEDLDRWKNEVLPDPPSRYRKYTEGKPDWVINGSNLDHLLRTGITRKQELEQNARLQLQMLWSLDQAIGSILNKLESSGKLDNTLIIYLSDNGVMWGEHSLMSKDCVYQEAVKVPFGMRYPALISANSENSSLVANIDIAPTVLDFAGLHKNKRMDGVSLFDVLDGSEIRNHLILEGFRSDGPRKPFVAIHTNRYVYSLNRNDISELYDLSTDPYQITNLTNSPSRFELKQELHQRLLHELATIRRNGSAAAKVYNPLRE